MRNIIILSLFFVWIKPLFAQLNIDVQTGVFRTSVTNPKEMNLAERQKPAFNTFTGLGIGYRFKNGLGLSYYRLNYYWQREASINSNSFGDIPDYRGIFGVLKTLRINQVFFYSYKIGVGKWILQPNLGVEWFDLIASQTPLYVRLRRDLPNGEFQNWQIGNKVTEYTYPNMLLGLEFQRKLFGPLNLVTDIRYRAAFRDIEENIQVFFDSQSLEERRYTSSSSLSGFGIVVGLRLNLF